MNALNLTRIKVTSLALSAFGLLSLSNSSARPLVTSNPSSPAEPGALRTQTLTIETNGAARKPAALPIKVPYAPGVADVVHLVDAGVGTEIIKAYIQNSTHSFSLNANEIISLKDRGVGSDLVLAMLNRSGELRAEAVRLMAARPAPPALSQAPAQEPAVNYAPPQQVYYTEPQVYYTASPTYVPSYPYWYSYNYSYPWYYPSYSYWFWSAPLYYRHGYHHRGGYAWNYPHRWGGGHRAYGGRAPYYAPASRYVSYSPRANWGGGSRFGSRPGGFSGRPFGGPGHGMAPGRGFGRGR